MDNYRVGYTDEALQDLRDIYEYISVALHSAGTAESSVRRIRDEIRSLCFFPDRYRVVDWEPWASLRMRRSVVGNFIIFYLSNEEERSVQIVRILYGRRDLPDAAINTPAGR